LKQAKEQHARALEFALLAARSSADEADKQYQIAKEENKTLRSELNKTMQELEVKTQEAELAKARVAEVEEGWARTHASPTITPGPSRGKWTDEHKIP